MSVASPMKILANRHNREAAKRREDEKKKNIDEAIARRARLIERAVSFGASLKDPLFIQCVIAHYRVRPAIHGNKLVINLQTGKNHTRFIGKHSRVVGEVHFLPLGGIAGVKVFDSKGEIMVCTGTCVPDAKWSFFTRGFYLIPEEA